MNHHAKPLIPTLLCTAWCATCVWYTHTYVGAGRDLIPLVQGEQTHRMLRFNATTLRPTNEERVAMVEGLDKLVTWKLMIESLESNSSPDVSGPIQLRFEVREKGKNPIVLFNDIHAYVDASRNAEPFPILVGMRPVGGSITKASKLEFRLVKEGTASSPVVDNPFRMTTSGSYGTTTRIAPGTYAAESSQSVPLYTLSYGENFPQHKRTLFLTVRRLRRGYFGE